MKKIFYFKCTLYILSHGYLALTILSFFTLPNEMSFLLGSYSLMHSFLGFLAFDNVIMQMVSLIYFFVFSIVLIIVYLKAVVRKRYKGMLTMTIIDCVIGLVILCHRIVVNAFDGLHLVSVLLRILFSIIFYYTIKIQCNSKHFDYSS